MTRPFVMEAWPAGTRLRALRHALRYRRRAQAWAHALDSLLLGAELEQRHIDRLEARVAALEAAIDEHRRLMAAGIVGEAERVLREARG